eukprot:XP_001695481.1 predicted protein [Chlamydomonas reinhardtii]
MVPATLWDAAATLREWPPPTQGPAAIGRKFAATLIPAGPNSPGGGGSGSAPALVLLPLERAYTGRGGQGGATDGGHGYLLVDLEGVTIDLLREQHPRITSKDLRKAAVQQQGQQALQAQQGQGQGADKAAEPPRPRGRNPFGFILSRFGRRNNSDKQKQAGSEAASPRAVAAGSCGSA